MADSTIRSRSATHLDRSAKDLHKRKSETGPLDWDTPVGAFGKTAAVHTGDTNGTKMFQSLRKTSITAQVSLGHLERNPTSLDHSRMR